MDPAEFSIVKLAAPGYDETSEAELVCGIPSRYGGILANSPPESAA